MNFQTYSFFNVAATAFDDLSGNSYEGINDEKSLLQLSKKTPIISGPSSKAGAKTSNKSINENENNVYSLALIKK